jgi:ABC-2 type transport system ATP-binding protein
MTAIVQVKGLEKVYRVGRQKLHAVKGIDLELEQGDIFGFIGPNGAGKTTTLKILATLLPPTAGTALIAGHDVVTEPDAVREVIGYMPDFFGVYDDIKVWEYLDFFAAAYRIPKARRAGIIDDVLALTDLTDKKDSYVESLSRGMKQRLCLAKTLIHDPKVLLLDEPASGLDPRARIELKELLKELQAMGKTIIVSSHILPEMEEFCNKIGIIERGEMVVAGDVQQIARQIRGQQFIEITIADGLPIAEQLLHNMPEWVHSVQRCGTDSTNGDAAAPPPLRGTLRIGYIGAPEGEYEVLTALVQARVKVRAFHPVKTDLEDVFLRFTKGQVA